MTDAGAKVLAEAIDRLAAAIERAAGLGATSGGIHVYHHDSRGSTIMPPGPGSVPARPQTLWGEGIEYRVGNSGGGGTDFRGSSGIEATKG
jgi:hypothetical protein